VRIAGRSITGVAVPLALLAASQCLTASHARAQWTERVQVRHAAYATAGAPSALVHAAASFDPSRPLQLIVYLHGFMGCAEVLMGRGSVACKPGEPELTGWDLARAHDDAGTNTLLVIPQLAFMRRNGRPGCFGRSGCFREFVKELLQALPSERLGGRKTLADVEAITLVAHSAGYRAAAAILEHGDVQTLVRNVVLFDALYGESEAFLDWITSGKDREAHLLSLHTGEGLPARYSAQLLRAARRALGSERVAKLDAEIEEPSFGRAPLTQRVAIARAQVPHREVPAAYLTRVLRALGASDDLATERRKTGEQLRSPARRGR
jgi:hypothetical protein